jgi:hypothetical protein
MPPAPYPDFRWFFRAIRVLPVVAAAALVGGIIGGFSVFALDLALTAPPNRDVSAEVGKISAEKASESAAATVPVAGTSAPPVPGQTRSNNAPSVVAVPQPTPPSQAQTTPQIAVTPSLSPQQTTWPDALSRERKAAPDTAASVTPPPAAPPPITATPQPAPLPKVQAGRTPDSASVQSTKAEITRKPMPAKWRVAVKRNSEPVAGDNEASARTGRPVYDFYGHADEAGPPEARVRAKYSHRRHYSRRERAADDGRSADGYAEQADRGSALPPQPPPPPLFFGLFGGGDRYDDQ